MQVKRFGGAFARDEQHTQIARVSGGDARDDGVERVLLAEIERRLREQREPVEIVEVVRQYLTRACSHREEIAVMKKFVRSRQIFDFFLLLHRHDACTPLWLDFVALRCT